MGRPRNPNKKLPNEYTYFHCKMTDEIKEYMNEEKKKSGLTWESFLKNLIDEHKLSESMYGSEISLGKEEV